MDMMFFAVVMLIGAVTNAVTGIQSQQPNKEDSNHNMLQTRQKAQTNCVLGIYSSSCWDALDLTNWLSNWYLTTLPCAEETKIAATHCRTTEETWTDTFLRVAQNITGGPSCVELNACLGDSPNSKEIRQDVNSVEAARYRYVCYNIYGNMTRLALMLLVIAN